MARLVKILVAVLILAGVGAAALTQFSEKRRPNVVLIMLDTLRADHLGYLGYKRDTSPVLDSFASKSVRFPYAVTSAPWTPPAVGSMFTGLYPSSHGMMPPNARQLAQKTSASLDAKNNTLAEIFLANGYQTSGVTPNPWITEEFGYNQGFESYYYRDRARAEEINRAAKKVLDGFSAEKPFFLFLHYLDPHDPYDPPAPYDKKFVDAVPDSNYDEEMTRRINLYDGEISYLDEHLGHLFADMEKRGLFDNTVFLIIADHGEQFNERGHQGHGFKLFDEEVHVPALVRAPGLAPREDQLVVSPIDVMPTLLKLAKIEVPAGIQGISMLDQQALQKRAGVMSEINRKFNLKSITNSKRERLMLDFGADSDIQPVANSNQPTEPAVYGLYDASKDPKQVTALNDAQRAKELKLDFDSIYQDAIATSVKTEAVTVKNETLEQLKSLGYLK